MEDSRWDHCVTAAALVLNTIDSSPGASKAELMGQVVFIILHAIKAYESERYGLISPSVN